MLRHWMKQLKQEGRRRRRGMTLTEVIVAIALVVILMGILGIGAFVIFDNTKVETTKLQMGEIAKRIEIFALKKGPPSSSDGLKAVYKGGEEIPKDTWGNDFIFMSPGPNGAPFDLISLGSDGAEGGTDNAADIKWSEKSTW